MSGGRSGLHKVLSVQMMNLIGFVAVALLTWIGTAVFKTSSLIEDLFVLAAVVGIVYVLLYRLPKSSGQDGKDSGK
jgi:hypothetical protein